MVRGFVLLSLIAYALLTPVYASDSICDGIATRNTIPSEHFSYALRKGEQITAITQYNIDKQTGETSICSHGGGCYPAGAIKLTNCKVDRTAPAWEDDETVSYGLTLLRSKVDPARLRENDLELQLIGFGMCSACANNAAVLYMQQPRSKCGKLIKRALEGNPDAKDMLGENPDFCFLQ